MENLRSIEGHPVFPGSIYLENDTVVFLRIGRNALGEYSTETLQAQHEYQSQIYLQPGPFIR